MPSVLILQPLRPLRKGRRQVLGVQVKRAYAVGFAILIASSLATAQESAPSAPTTRKAWVNEPDGYRGLKWGASVGAAAEVLDSAEMCLCIYGTDDNSVCKPKPEKDPEKIPSRRVCFTTFDVGPVKVKDQITFVNDALAAVSMTFDTDDYERIRAIFIEKYGEPASREASEVHNRMGAAFQQEELDWKGQTVVVSLSRFGSKLTQGAAYITTSVYRDLIIAETEAEKKNATKAF